MVSPVISVHNFSDSARSLTLASSLRRLRIDAELAGNGASIHQLRNAVMTAQGALGLVETRLSEGRGADVETLLELAETRLREGRRLLTRTRGPDRHSCTPDGLVAHLHRAGVFQRHIDAFTGELREITDGEVVAQ